MRRNSAEGLKHALLLGLVVVVTCVAYARSFTVPFQFDDQPQIVENHAVYNPSLRSILYRARARIIPLASLALNYSLGGEDPFGYHVVNFFVHLITSFLVYGLVLTLCRTPVLRNTAVARQSSVVATAAALLFASHPIQIQAVTYVVQRMSSMAAMFCIGSVLLYVASRNREFDSSRFPRVWYGGALLMALGAFLSKENSASLPLVLVLTEWTFYPARWSARRLARLVPFFLLVLVIPICWTVFGPPARTPFASLGKETAELLNTLPQAAQPRHILSPIEYFLTQCTVVPRYLRLVFLPWGFNVDHDVSPVRGFSPAFIAGSAFLITIFAFGIYAVRRWPLAGFGILWMFLALSVESTFLPLTDLMFEHRMYLAMAGITMVVANAFGWAVRRWPAPALSVGFACLALLTALTVVRHGVWQTHESLWRDALAKSPAKARPYVNVGTYVHLAGKPDEAIRYYCKALEIDPDYSDTDDKLYRALADKSEDGSVRMDLDRVNDDGSRVVVVHDPCPSATSDGE